MNRVLEHLNAYLASIDASLAQCNANLENASGFSSNDLKAVIYKNHEMRSFLIKNRKVVADKIERIMCEMVSGW